jgi:hypothetical protein
MRRTHLRGHTNILKRLLIHAGGFNLGLVMRHPIGIGTPRGLQDRPATVMAALLVLLGATRRWLVAISAWHPLASTAHCFMRLTCRGPPRLMIFSSPLHPPRP